jgi:hypothetical protein
MLLRPGDGECSSCCAVIHAEYIALRIAYVKGKHCIYSGADGLHDAVLHTIVAEGNDLAIGSGDALYFAAGGLILSRLRQMFAYHQL